ncbi:amino acid permease family protein [Coccidioides posadasii C735 delta SOWgp]|uniref:Amino acid permease family protein n=1 Tax=Coccidioides posadasii (strain C735) TaxID=222929 RepID=C5PE14_COCP7|nr:amino acid permease family protein [Coccidioides posadasii C735 delta SOWgp]EER25325.1 amino acid permease family protein [Coccidioides posadasii C735 delta SOWgp]|eukprot:XP_003067470.1 amino acid permease family protein [Coccidioides posadasii C735 delta SOWgp]
MMGGDAGGDATGRGMSAADGESPPPETEQPYQPLRSASASSLPFEGWKKSTANSSSRRSISRNGDRRSQRAQSATRIRRASLSSQLPGRLDFLDRKEKGPFPPTLVDVSKKLGTFSGVFVPTTLNVLSILMFLRFGFILGQSGVLGMLGMLVASYMINLVTTMSISAIATNGTVRGGGAYYLISRSLGPEFGGSIGTVFYIGCVFNTGMNAVGLVDCLTQSFGSASGSLSNFLLEGFWWQYLWGTIVLVLCTGICLAGSSMFARASNGLLAVLLVATYSIPLSPLLLGPFANDKIGIEYTGFSLTTFLGNLKPGFTKGAAGSQIPGKESFQNLFGILYPATGGIFAGASMSGDLKNPSRSIPKGTLSGLGLTFATYTIVILVIASTVTRESLYRDVNIIQDINMSAALIVLGEFATTFFSALMGLIGASKLLQAIARDDLIPGVSFFARGTPKTDEPTRAIIFTFVIAQLTMLLDINQIASFITMIYLMTFLVTNLACFLLKIGSAPNFRPSFHYFNSWTALAGALVSGTSMFFVDGVYAAGCVCVLVLLFLLIHYTTPPKSWGDVSQSLIYHQVRKYLLRLRPEHVKFWRPQVLLFVDNFDVQYKMIHFCNSLKKGGLFVLGHILVTKEFASAVPEARREQTLWNKFVEYSKVKAFVNVTVAPTIEWGVRNVVLNSGLGGMRPNIVVIDQFRRQSGRLSAEGDDNAVPARGRTSARQGPRMEVIDKACSMSVQSYVTVLEDLLFKLRINVAIARGFEDLELPSPTGRGTKRYIDLWPIQMSAEFSGEGCYSSQNIVTTNFDTYTLILQLGCILHTVPSWKNSYKLRVAVFVEYETDVEEERGRVATLLEKLRIEAEVLVFWLASGGLKSYKIIVNGEQAALAERARVDSVLEEEDWWQEIKRFRKGEHDRRTKGRSGQPSRPHPTWLRSQEEHENSPLRKFIESSRRRRSVGSLGGMAVSLGMQTQRLLDSMVDYHPDESDESSSGGGSEMEAYVSEADDEDEDVDADAEDIGDEPSSPAEARTTPRSAFLGSPRKPRIDARKRRVGSVSESAVTDSEDSGTEASTSCPAHPAISRVKAEGTAPSRDKSGMVRTSSTVRFSSAPIPETKVATEEGTGPSIMFAATDLGRPGPRSSSSIYKRPSSPDHPRPESSARADRASGYPLQASVPLSFNDLPRRAQHLIVNELMKSHSKKTAVIMTTLPSPVEGTCRDPGASQQYLSDLEVLYSGLPPCLLVHSNSMTVTMNL